MKLGRFVFYDVIDGSVILITSEYGYSVRQKTVDEQIATYKELTDRNRETFDAIELPYGAYRQDFETCNGYRVDLETKKLEFSYPDPNEPEAPPVYQAPLSETVNSNTEYLVDLDFRLSMSEMGL